MKVKGATLFQVPIHTKTADGTDLIAYQTVVADSEEHARKIVRAHGADRDKTQGRVRFFGYVLMQDK